MPDFEKFFSPLSLAFIGASSDPAKWGFRVLSNIVGGKYEGKIYPVNPKGGEILGLPVFTSLEVIPGIPDLAILVVPPPAMMEAVQACIKKGIKAGVVITAGFAEVSSKGAQIQDEIVKIARAGGMSLIGPNCFGILSTPVKLYAQMPQVYPPVGPIAVVSQSGNVGLTISRRAMALDFGCSRVISTGNEADLHVEDFIEFLSSDAQTRVILSYIEGFKDGRRFFKIAQEATLNKPIVMIKVGETEAGASAAKSHTAALSGSQVVFEGMCRQAGITRAKNLHELMNIGYGFLCHPIPRGKRVGIVTLGGGWGALAADACAKLGLEVVKLSDEIMRELDSFLPGWWSRNNPIDLVAGAMGDEMLRAIEILAKWENIDGIIALGIPVSAAVFSVVPQKEDEIKQRMEQIKGYYFNAFKSLKDIMQKYNKPVILAAELPIPSGNRTIEQELIRETSRMGLVSYTMPDEAATVMNALVRYGDYLRGR